MTKHQSDNFKLFIPIIIVILTFIGGMWKQSIQSSEQHKAIVDKISVIENGNICLRDKIDKLREDVNDKFVRKDNYHKETTRNESTHQDLWRKINQFLNTGE